MRKIWKAVIQLQIWREEHGQDLVEYAMIGGFLAVASGVCMPGVAKNISTVFSKISTTMTSAASQS